jgi:hypothetical protein
MQHTNDTPDTDASNRLGLDRRTALKGAGIGLGLLTLGSAGTGSAVAASGANKVYAAESDLAEIGLGSKELESQAVTLMSGSFKTSDKSDLIVQSSAEVSLHTDIKTKGNDESWASAGVECWVELDGTPISWTPGTVGSGLDDGKVVFNNREFGLKTSNFENEEAMIELFLRTRSAHGFNWYAVDVGSGEHTIELKANIKQFVDGNGEAKALVGPRTLIVEPVNMGSA